MEKKKIPQSSTVVVEVPKKLSRAGRKKDKPALYPDMFFMRDWPMNEAVAERLAREYMEWADLETSLVLADFRLDKKICVPTWLKIVKEFSCLAEAHRYAKERLASRRERGAMIRKFDSGFVLRTMPIYSDEFKELEEWRSNLSKKEDDSGGTKIVVIERMPDVPEVKNKVD